MAPFRGFVVVPQFSRSKQQPRTCIRHSWPVRKIPTESLSAKKPGNPGFLLVIRKDHSAISNKQKVYVARDVLHHNVAVIA